MTNRFRSKVTPKPVSEETIPLCVDPELFEAGYQHGLVSNKLEVHQLKRSFRLGFRKAKLEIMEQLKLSNLPQKFKISNT